MKIPLILIAIGFILSLIFMNTLDSSVSLYFGARLDSPLKHLADNVQVYGQAGYWLVLALLIVVYSYFDRTISDSNLKKKYIRLNWIGVLFIYSTFLVSGIFNRILKISFGRQRPKLFFETHQEIFEPFSSKELFDSFPSGHSLTGWVGAVSFGYLFPRYRAFLFIFALLISSSRVITTRHFVSDVIMGAFVGIAITIWIKNKFAKKCIDLFPLKKPSNV